MAERPGASPRRVALVVLGIIVVVAAYVSLAPLFRTGGVAPPGSRELPAERETAALSLEVITLSTYVPAFHDLNNRMPDSLEELLPDEEFAGVQPPAREKLRLERAADGERLLAVFADGYVAPIAAINPEGEIAWSDEFAAALERQQNAGE